MFLYIRVSYLWDTPPNPLIRIVYRSSKISSESIHKGIDCGGQLPPARLPAHVQHHVSYFFSEVKGGPMTQFLSLYFILEDSWSV